MAVAKFSGSDKSFRELIMELGFIDKCTCEMCSKRDWSVGIGWEQCLHRRSPNSAQERILKTDEAYLAALGPLSNTVSHTLHHSTSFSDSKCFRLSCWEIKLSCHCLSFLSKSFLTEERGESPWRTASVKLVPYGSSRSLHCWMREISSQSVQNFARARQNSGFSLIIHDTSPQCL